MKTSHKLFELQVVKNNYSQLQGLTVQLSQRIKMRSDNFELTIH